MELKGRINSSLGGFHNNHEVSHTLISKILLGALGCTVAYDTNIRLSLRKTKIASAAFSEKSILALCEFYENNNLHKYEQKFYADEKEKIHYPPMKILDMALWSAKCL